MTLFRLLLRNLAYHWRGNLAVLLGVVVGSTVLTGALLVGDSLRGSLRDRTLARLGAIDQSLVAPRFFRAALADEILEGGSPVASHVEPALLLQGTVSPEGADDPRGAIRPTVRGVTVLGVRGGFLENTTFPEEGDVVWLNSALADALGVKEGEEVVLHLQKPGALPAESVLGSKTADVREWRVRVGKVLQGSETGNLFSLRAELEAPRNAFVPLKSLQEQIGQAGRANALLVQGGKPGLQERLRSCLRLDDWGLVLRTPRSRADDLFARARGRGKAEELPRGRWADLVKDSQPTPSPGLEKLRPRAFAGVIASHLDLPASKALRRSALEAYYRKAHPYISLESRQLLLERPVADAALEAARDARLTAAPTLVYLCRLESGERRIAGVVAALNPALPAPLGPFLPPGKKELPRGQIVVVEEGWPGKKPEPGATVTVTFKPPESHGPAPNRHKDFTLAGFIPLAGAAADPDLTPEFPGITDKKDPSEWSLPFEDPKWDRETIRREYTDDYWYEYRATPRAYVNLADGEELWQSRFGVLTSVRLAESEPGSLEESARHFADALLAKLDPRAGGFVFEDVKQQALEASAKGGDFSWLFAGFSFFLIAAALLLVGLLYRLNLDRRAQEVGVLLAEGYPLATVRWLLLGEGAVLALAGALLGAALGIVYSALLVQLLSALWPGGVLKSFLRPHWTWVSLGIGSAGMLVVSVLTIAWVVRALGKVPARALLAGQTTEEGVPGGPGKATWSKLIAVGAGLAGLALLVAGRFMPGTEAQAGTFFTSGALFLTASLAGVSAWMRTRTGSLVDGRGLAGVIRLGVRNAARYPARSLLTVGLLASAAFLLVAVESFRRKPEVGRNGKDAPNGGFSLLAESDLPVYRDLSSEAGRQEVLTRYERRLLDAGRKPEVVERDRAKTADLLARTEILGLRVHGGDDASCLNLYQPRRPRILGVPTALIERGGFVFDETNAATEEERKDHWQILRRDPDALGAIPCFGEANTVTWMLKSGLGKTISVPDEGGNPVALRIDGLLHDSVFQSSLLVWEGHFLKLYPSTEGYSFFLIRPPDGQEKEVKEVLETALADRGFEVTPSAVRLASYLAVENTYLSTFQALGGLGLILGALGLAVVLLRAVWERRAELALLRALGFRQLTLGLLVLAENAFLLLVGLALGSISALLSISLYLAAGKGAVPWLELLALFAVVAVVGLVSCTLAVLSALRAPIVPALRRE